MKMSGASRKFLLTAAMSWSYFFDGEIPRFLRFIQVTARCSDPAQDRDIWAWADPDSKPFTTAFYAFSQFTYDDFA